MQSFSRKCSLGAVLFMVASGVAGVRAFAQTNPQAKPQTLLINRHALAVDTRTQRLYAVDEAHDRVLIVDCRSGHSVSVHVGHEPDALGVDARTGRVYVVNVGSATVSVIDEARNAVIATVSTGRAPYSIAIDEELDRIFVGNTYSNMLTVIDGATNTVKGLPLGAQDVLAVDPVRHRLVMFGYEGSTIKVLDEKTEQVSTMHAVPHLWGLAVDARDGEFYIPEIGNNALFVAGKSAIPVGKLPDAVAIDAAHDRMFVTNYGTGATPSTVSEIDATLGKAIATIPVGIRPQAVAIDARRGLVYVANSHGDTVTVIDEASAKVLATLPGGHTPYALALDPASGAVFAANYGMHPYSRLNNAALLNKQRALVRLGAESTEKGNIGQ
jgi:YVTN family beta-propeller protein